MISTTARLSDVATMHGRIGWQNLRRDEFTESGPYLVTGMHFTEMGDVDWEKCFHISEERYEMAPEIQLEHDDLLFTKDGSIGKVAHIRALPGKASLNSHLLVIRSRSGEFIPRYLFYVLNSQVLRDYVEIEKRGTTFYGITQEAMSGFRFSLPEPADQGFIADFLDRETERIDALVGAKRKLIDLLAEKRTALITHAVTKGLDPSVPMKVSGIPWIGEIPAHWKVLTVRRVTRTIQTGTTPPTAESRFYENGSVPWYGPSSFGLSADVAEPAKLLNRSALSESSVKPIPAGSTLVVAIGATLGKSAFLGREGTSNQQISALVPNGLVRDRFLAWLMKAAEPILISQAPQTTLPILNNGTLADVPIPLPPLGEQDTLIQRLGEWNVAFRRAVDRIATQLDLLAEYRQALITAAVTGQLDEDKLKGMKPAVEAMEMKVPS